MEIMIGDVKQVNSNHVASRTVSLLCAVISVVVVPVKPTMRRLRTDSDPHNSTGNDMRSPTIGLLLLRGKAESGRSFFTPNRFGTTNDHSAA